MKRMQRVFGDYDSLRYVDGWLDEDRRAAFLHHLATDPAEAERVGTWTRQNEAIRAAFAGVALEPVPPALRLNPVVPAARPAMAPAAGANVHVLPNAPVGRARTAPASDGRAPEPHPAEPPVAPPRSGVRHRIALTVASLALAAAVVLLAVRALVQGVGLPREEVVQLGAMARAADAHVTYAGEPFRADENVAAGIEALVSTMQRRSALAVSPPDLSALGWTLRASRLVPGVGGPAAFFIYADASDERLGLFIGRAGDGRSGAALGPAGTRGAALAWERGDAAFVITTGRTPDWLSRNGQRLRAAVEGALR